jgi:hypothetical protein
MGVCCTKPKPNRTKINQSNHQKASTTQTPQNPQNLNINFLKQKAKIQKPLIKNPKNIREKIEIVQIPKKTREISVQVGARQPIIRQATQQCQTGENLLQNYLFDKRIEYERLSALFNPPSANHSFNMLQTSFHNNHMYSNPNLNNYSRILEGNFCSQNSVKNLQGNFEKKNLQGNFEKKNLQGNFENSNYSFRKIQMRNLNSPREERTSRRNEDVKSVERPKLKNPIFEGKISKALKTDRKKSENCYRNYQYSEENMSVCKTVQNTVKNQKKVKKKYMAEEISNFSKNQFKTSQLSSEDDQNPKSDKSSENIFLKIFQ